MASSSGPAPGFALPSTTGTAIPETIGRYRLLHKIAKGGMAEVFAARSYGAHGFEKTVALKRILPKFGRDPQFVRMMVDEAKISVLLNHQNIAQILELGEQDGDYFIVMEFVPGQSLSAVVKRLRDDGVRLATLESCFVVVELLQGLHAAHTQRDASGKPARIIHRDVSPQNTLVSFDGHVKVIDFGIARARDRLEATEVGTIKGKLRYLAPEMIDPGRFHPDGDFDHRVDVFAAGIVLWELLSGRTLFPGDDEMKVYDDITDGVTPDLHDEGLCDAALMRIVHKALERDLARRYATAEDFADDLRAYVYRTDPAFTHKRVAATLDRLFPDEKAELLALERGQTVHSEPTRGLPELRPAAAGSSSSPSSPSPSPSPPLAAARSSSGGFPAARAVSPDTRTMRSDKSGGTPVAAGALAAADAATAVGDRERLDPRGELARGRELTVMTIVSRDSVLGAALGGLDLPAEHSSGDGVFSGSGDATLTVSADMLRGAREAEVRRARSAATTPATAASSGPRVVPLAPAVAPRSPSGPPPAAMDASSPTPAPAIQHGAGVGGRVVALSAAAGVLLAVLIVAVVEHLREQPPAVVVAGAAPSSPSSSASSPPAIAVSGPTAPAEAAPRAAVERRVTPVDAVVTIDGRSLTAGSTVAVDVPVVVEVAAPGYVTARQELRARAGGPLVVAVDLAPAGVPNSGPEPETTPPKESPREPPREPARDTVRPPPKEPPREPAKGRGTLLVKAAPYWGQVTVDGKVLDDQTPVSVALSAGVHDVVVSHPPRGLVKRFKVTIAPGETAVRAVTFD